MFIDSCANYYSNGFKDCLKQVNSAYPTLDFSKITMDEPLPTMPADDTALRESDDFSESLPDLKDGVILAQPATDAPITSLISSTFLEIVEGSVQDA